jgi:hypothetical protein
MVTVKTLMVAVCCSVVLLSTGSAHKAARRSFVPLGVRSVDRRGLTSVIAK